MAGKLTVAVAAAMALALAGVPQAGADGGGRVVQTDNGAVSGTVNSDYRLFGSIPYAVAPVGANRWRDPRPVAPWRGVRDASRPSPVCAQTPQLGERASDVEDCLYLNVVTPARKVHGEFASPAFGTGVLPVSPLVAQNTGRVHRVPTLVGSTHDEMTMYVPLFAPGPLPDSAFPAKAALVFGQELGARVVARYPLNGNGDARDELAAALTDRSWACPTHVTRQLLGRRMPVSGYEFAERDMPMIFPDMPPFPGGYGAYHASGLPLLFEFEGVPLTPGQRALSDHVVTAWGRFARTGDPGWEAQVQSLAAGAVGPTDFATDHQCDFWGQQ